MRGGRSAGILPAPYAYAALQILGDAIEANKTPDQQAVAASIREHEFEAIVGKVKFGLDGEWARPRVLQVQYQHIQGHDVEQFQGPDRKVVLYPEEYRSGSLIYP